MNPRHLPPHIIKILIPALALAIAEIAHRGQQDKSGAPYIDHLTRVAHRLTADKDKTIAFLHDILEDTSVTRADLVGLFPAGVVEAVEILSRRPDETYSGFIDRICNSQNLSAIFVKYADVQDHLKDTSSIGPSLVHRYTQAEARLRDAVCLDVIKTHGHALPAVHA